MIRRLWWERPALVGTVLAVVVLLGTVLVGVAGAWRFDTSAYRTCETEQLDLWVATFHNTEPDRDRYVMDVRLDQTGEVQTVVPGESADFELSTTHERADFTLYWADGRPGVDGRPRVHRPSTPTDCEPPTTTTTTTSVPPTTTTAPPTTTTEPPTTTTQPPVTTTVPPTTTAPPTTSTAPPVTTTTRPSTLCVPPGTPDTRPRTGGVALPALAICDTPRFTG